MFFMCHASRRQLDNKSLLQQSYPHLDEEGQLVQILEEILDVRERRLRSKVIREYLVKWRDLPMRDVTWEGDKIL